MGSPIALASALSRLVAIKCPWCGNRKLVSRKPAKPLISGRRVCPTCHKHFPDPLATKKKK